MIRNQQNLPEHGIQYESRFASNRSEQFFFKFDRTPFMNDMTYAGDASFESAKLDSNLNVQGRKNLVNANLAWGGPYKILTGFLQPKYIEIVEDLKPRNKVVLSKEDELKKKSRTHYHTTGRNLNDFPTYSGEFENRLPSGYGIIVFEGGEAYRGMWKKGLPHGNGVFISKTGNGYAGEFKKGQPQGKGQIWVWDWYRNEVVDTVEGEWVGGDWYSF